MNYKSKVWFVLSCGALLAAGVPPLWAGSFEVYVGPYLREGMTIRVEGGSYAGQSGLGLGRSGTQLPSPIAPSAPMDNINQFGDRSFDNGFVYRDAATEGFGGDTWYWGYQDAAQYDPATGVLNFQRGSRMETSADGYQAQARVLRNDVFDDESRVNGVGFAAGAGYALWAGERFSVALRGGIFGLFDIHASVSSELYRESFEKTRLSRTDIYQVEESYTYDLMGVIPPAAPYSGTYDGPGPLLPNRPLAYQSEMALVSQSQRAGRVERRQGWAEVQIESDADMLALWAAPAIVWQPHARVAFFAQPRLTLQRIRFEASRDETWYINDAQGTRAANHMQDTLSETEWAWGCGIGAGFDAALGERFFLRAEGIYDWVEKKQWELGPNALAFDASGASVSIAMGLSL